MTTGFAEIQKRVISRVVRRPRLLNYAQKVRYLIFRGPFQDNFVRYYQKRSKTPSIALPEPSIFPGLNVEKTLNELEENGYSIAFQLTARQIEQLIEYKTSMGSDGVRKLYRNCECFDQIACDPSIVSVVRRYIGAEPIIYASSLYFTGPKTGAVAKEPVKNRKIVHFDANDFKDLNLFIYLNDVDDETSPHFVIKGTHKKKKMRDLITRWYTWEEMVKRFGSKIKSITGPAGLAFFEDTSAFHIQNAGTKGRFTIAICYTLQRSPELARYND